MHNRLYFNKTYVRFYDVIWEKMLDSPTKDFYRKEISKKKGPVLELGTGTGRLFIPALNSGADIYGIDISETMQDYLKGKLDTHEYFRLKIADARNFEFEIKFKLTIAPFNFLCHMLTIEDQLAVLRCISKHMDKEGEFIFDVFLPDLMRVKNGNELTLRAEGEYEPGKKFQWFDSAKPDYINQLSHCTFKYVWEENNGTHEDKVEFPFRYYFRYELEHLIARSGLKLEKMYGDFEYNEFNNNSKYMICVCKKINTKL